MPIFYLTGLARSTRSLFADSDMSAKTDRYCVLRYYCREWAGMEYPHIFMEFAYFKSMEDMKKERAYMDMQGFHYNLDALFPSEPDFLEDEELCQKDLEYFKRLYPKEVRLTTSVLEEYLDRYEYEGSPMYAQYPDAVTIYRMAGEIWNMLAMKVDADVENQWKNMLQIMVCQEMYVRRRRHDKFCRKFRECGIR